MTGHNNANRMIVAYRVYFNVVRPDGQLIDMRHRHDHFFKDDSMLVATSPQPQLDFVPNDIDCQGWFSVGSGGGYTPPPVKPARTHVKTVFVQFDDGSTWGDAEAVQEIMFQRPEALAYLQSLRAAYVSGGAKALTQALHQPIHHPDHKFRVTANTKRLLLLDLPDPQAQIDSIDVDLATAATRTSWLR